MSYTVVPQVAKYQDGLNVATVAGSIPSVIPELIKRFLNAYSKYKRRLNP
jgi:hypothetical protein